MHFISPQKEVREVKNYVKVKLWCTSSCSHEVYKFLSIHILTSGTYKHKLTQLVLHKKTNPI